MIEPRKKTGERSKEEWVVIMVAVCTVGAFVFGNLLF